MALGTVTFLTNGRDAALRALKDVATFQSRTSGIESAPGIPPLVIAGAIGQLVSARAGLTSASVGLASQINKGALASDALEIEFNNFASEPLVIFNYDPSNLNVSRIAEPLAAGQSDVVLLTSPTGFKDGASIQIDLFVGEVPMRVTYELSNRGDPGRWVVSMTIDGQQKTFDRKLQLIGALFASADGRSKSFSVFTSPIETSSGQIDLTFYSVASL